MTTTESPLTAGTAIRDAMFAAAEYAVHEMRDSDQISAVTAGRMLGEVSKALELIAEEGVLTTEVSKALDYGTVSTDSAMLTNGGAAMRSGLSTYEKKKAAKQLHDLTSEGETPFQKGFDFVDDPCVPVADYLMQECGYDDDDSLDIAELFLKRVAAKIAGR